MNKNLLLLLLSVSILVFVSCKDEDEEQNITLSQSHVFLKNGGNLMDNDTKNVSILTGNGDYKLTLVDGSENLVDAEIVDDIIEFKSNKTQGRATFLLQDKLGKEKEIIVYVDEKYFLLEVDYYAVQVKASNSIVENQLKEELLADKPFESGTVLEMVSPGTVAGFRIYDSMADVVNGRIKKQGVFELDLSSPGLSFTVDNKFESFELLSSITYVIYQYFGIKISSGETNVLRSSPPVFEKLSYDLTRKYQEKYPEAKIEYARIILSAKPYLYKFVPVNL